MNKEFSKHLITWLENLGNLASTELPAFVQEVANYGLLSNFIYAFLGVFVVIAFWRTSKKCFKVCDEKNDDGYAVTGVVILIAAIVPLVMTVNHLSLAIKALVSPRLYVIERFINK
jgi:putative Mn2+ efflux pump MntP